MPDIDDADGVDMTKGAVMFEVVTEEVTLPACRGEHLNSCGGVLK
jgi:hypothetical protein